MTTPSPSSPPDRRLTLQVGERIFTTTRSTLSESTFLDSLLSSRWTSNALPDGSYFIDVDPTLFEHILRYLRRGIYPLFYSPDKGHDYALYAALLEEARYLGILKLQTWLEEKRYLNAVEVSTWMETIDDGDTSFLEKTRPANEWMELYPEWGVKKTYLCPRRIVVHRGSPGACGRQCRNARGDREDKYDEEPVLKLFVVHKKVIFNGDVLRRQMSEDNQESKEGAQDTTWLLRYTSVSGT
ncbi:hypothetical protein BO94DRAFT_546819 [Aspergillus sclerotioniger CBS 115572]|uniref:BTB domain-containing protein n=1 Tax=Aspergillus sclerotioniger CBS 115572 TaxID=1450535 RepID=A0A317WKK7_9EURO|nr:hypothetical protein BO94DRAFT_546819 [Aspergillus sclerotioniger CBS 115572]PWY86595.1 hypothetical protein BO94DRAFT_546819 [Aspergillus sclerotioniger CBS 115572]